MRREHGGQLGGASGAGWVGRTRRWGEEMDGWGAGVRVRQHGGWGGGGGELGP